MNKGSVRSSGRPCQRCCGAEKTRPPSTGFYLFMVLLLRRWHHFVRAQAVVVVQKNGGPTNGFLFRFKFLLLCRAMLAPMSTTFLLHRCPHDAMISQRFPKALCNTHLLQQRSRLPLPTHGLRRMCRLCVAPAWRCSVAMTREALSVT